MNILAIDTATSVCSIALIANGEVAAHRISTDNANHAQLLPRFADEILREYSSIDAIALSDGPGSYTGLRIGASFAKGLAYGYNIPLVTISTLQVLVEQICLTRPISFLPTDILCPLLDARRMEVYTATFDTTGQILSPIEAQIIDSNSFADSLSDHRMIFFGDGAAKCQTVITAPQAVFIPNIVPDARYMGAKAEQLLSQGKTADLAYFEPFYLKQFVAAPSHIKGLK